MQMRNERFKNDPGNSRLSVCGNYELRCVNQWLPSLGFPPWGTTRAHAHDTLRLILLVIRTLAPASRGPSSRSLSTYLGHHRARANLASHVGESRRSKRTVTCTGTRGERRMWGPAVSRAHEASSLHVGRPRVRCFFRPAQCPRRKVDATFWIGTPLRVSTMFGKISVEPF